MSLEFTKELEDRMDRIMAEGLEESSKEIEKEADAEVDTEEETDTRKKYEGSGID
jgi:hypothetical protein